MTSETERLDTGLAAIFDSLMRDVHTCMPGRVVSLNRAAQTVSVQPCLKRKFKNADPADLPVIEDVPVVFPGAGDLWLVFDIPVDSYVLLVFSERAIAEWMEKGGSVDPRRYRKFHLSDAVAVPGLLPKPIQFSGGIPSDKIALRSPDGTKKAELDTGGVFTVNSTADAAALTSKVDTIIAAIHAVFSGWTPVANDGGAALKTAWLAAFGTPPTSATVASNKIKVDS